MRSSREYPEHPLVGVGALIHDGGKVLLIKRRFEPNKGRWSLPGGLVEVGERVEEAARREVREEVGIDVELEGLLQVADEIIPDRDGVVRYHYILVDFLAKAAGKEIQLNDESEDYAWFAAEDIEGLNASPNTKLIAKRYIERKEQNIH